MGARRLAALLGVGLSGLLAGACSTSDFGEEASAEELRTILAESDLDVCDARPLDWDIAGFEGGEAFHVGSDCDAPDDEHRRFKVVVAGFENETSRDLAQRAATTSIRVHHRSSSVWTYGPYLIVLEGEKDQADYDDLVDTLEDLGAE